MLVVDAFILKIIFFQDSNLKWFAIWTSKVDEIWTKIWERNISIRESEHKREQQQKKDVFLL